MIETLQELQQDELPSVDRVHEKTDHPRRGRTPAGEERERGSQNDLSHRYDLSVPR